MFLQQRKSPGRTGGYNGSIINVGVGISTFIFFAKEIDIFPKSQYNKVAIPKERQEGICPIKILSKKYSDYKM